MTPALFLAGVLTFIWPFVRGTSALVPLALIYGATSGAFAGLIGAPMIAFGDSTDVGRRMGMNLTILSLGALAGPPISGAISKSTGGYAAVGIYAGPFSFSSFFFGVSRFPGWRSRADGAAALSLLLACRVLGDGRCVPSRTVPVLRTAEMDRQDIVIGTLCFFYDFLYLSSLALLCMDIPTVPLSSQVQL